MGTVLKLLAGLLVVGGAVVVYQASTGRTPQCPSVPLTAMTAKQMGEALSGRNAVTITNSDATAIGRALAGDVVSDLRVCFDAKGGHASGEVSVGPLNLPFYVTVSRVDLTGRSPRVSELDFQLGSLPDAATNAFKSTITGLINDNLESIQLKQRYSYQLGDGSITVRAQ